MFNNDQYRSRIDEAANRIKNDPQLLRRFHSEPVKTIEDLLETNLPHDQVDYMVAGVRQQISDYEAEAADPTLHPEYGDNLDSSPVIGSMDRERDGIYNDDLRSRDIHDSRALDREGDRNIPDNRPLDREHDDRNILERAKDAVDPERDGVFDRDGKLLDRDFDRDPGDHRDVHNRRVPHPDEKVADYRDRPDASLDAKRAREVFEDEDRPREGSFLDGLRDKPEEVLERKDGLFDDDDPDPDHRTPRR